MKVQHAARWSGPGDIVASVRQLWDSGAILRARLESVPIFPYEIRLRQPGGADLGDEFDAVRHWIGALVGSSRTGGGQGYELVWRDINHRQLGRNRIPIAAIVSTEDDALRLIGRTAEARRFDRLARVTLEEFPLLRSWLSRQPLKLIEHSESWDKVLAVLRWFSSHPRAGLYLRQLDIEGVDTKFIEARKGLFTDLLNEIMPSESILVSANGVRQFEARFGLLTKPELIRFRVLDPVCYVGGLSDITVPVVQFAALDSNVRRVFSTENEVNARAFPASPSSMVIFGGGYGVGRLEQATWLADREVFYWGDIDTHGFVILDRLRSHVPHVRSLLMDADTLVAHRSLWGSEDPATRFTGELKRLREDEQQLFAALRDNVYATNLRLEQERIRYSWAMEAIASLTPDVDKD